ncbi:MAG: nucleotidyltransferase domain-containing protein [Methanoculleaceae archaeon]
MSRDDATLHAGRSDYAWKRTPGRVSRWGVKEEVDDLDRERIIGQLRRCLAGRGDILLGYLYGSFLRHGEFHDIDVALLVSGEREPHELYRYAMGIASDLERCITPGYEIDLRILNDAPIEFQYEVVKTGRLLVSRDEDTRIAFEAGVIAQFLDLKYLYDTIDRALLARVGE